MARRIVARRAAGGVVLIVLALLAAACTGGGDDESTREQGPAAEDTGAEDTADATAIDFGTPSTERITPEGESWLDPEVLDTGDELLLTWQQPGGIVRVAEVDPSTGLPKRGSIRTLTDDATPLSQTFNGPELGLDRSGWSVVYTRGSGDETEIVVAREADDLDPRVLPADVGRFTPLATTDAAADSLRLVYVEHAEGWGTAQWLDVDQPDDASPLVELAVRTDADLRWVPGTRILAANNLASEPDRLSLVDTDDGTIDVVSEPGLDLSTPYGWLAPETAGEVAALAVVDETDLVAWSAADGGAWRRWEVLPTPEPSLPYIASPEPFVAQGRSFVSLAAASAPSAVPGSTDQQIWLTSVDGRAAVRCDDGDLGPVTRVDPEVLVVGDTVFVYYYVLDGSSSIAYRCAVDIVPADGVQSEPGTTAPTVRLVTAEDTDPSLVTINGEHLAITPAQSTGRLLVFIPGTGARPDQYSTLLSHAARLGFHVVGVGYDNLESVAIQICPGTGDVACHEKVRREILFGEESGYSPPDVTPADSIQRRLEALLGYLARTYPEEGWDAFVAGAGNDIEIEWSRTTVAGHSQGGGHAGYLATQIPLDRVVLFGATEPAPWTTVDPATPVDRWWGLIHTDERNAAPILRSWDNLGIPGELSLVDGADPPYGGSHRLETATDECGGDPASRGFHHNCPVVDGYLPTDVERVLGEVWTQVLTG